MRKEIHIPLNRKRLLIQVVVFSLLGIGALIGAFGLVEQFGWNGIVVKGTGIVICVFCVVTAGAKAKQRADKNAGLWLTKEGLNDASSDISVGLIKWSDIIGVDEEESRQCNLLIVKVRKEEKYISKAKNSAVERLLRQNMRKFDTPIVIDPKYLMSDIEELIEQLKQ